MSHNITVDNSIEQYYLKSELAITLYINDPDDDAQNDSEQTIRFLCDYIPTMGNQDYDPHQSATLYSNACGYCTYLMRREGLNKIYALQDITYNDARLKTVYVLQQQQDSITRGELEKSKYTLMTLPIMRTKQQEIKECHK